MPGGDEIDERQIDHFMELAFQIIYGGDSPDGQLNSGVAQMLRRGPNGGRASDPVGALADTSAHVSAKALIHARGSGYNMDGAAAYAGLTNVVGELAGVAQESGIYNYDQQEIGSAIMRAGETFYREAQPSGAFPQDEMQRDMREMQAMDASGELDAMIDEMSATQGTGPPATAPGPLGTGTPTGVPGVTLP